MSHTKPSIKKDYRSLRNAKTVTMLFRRVFLTVADMSFPLPAENNRWEKGDFWPRERLRLKNK